MVRDADMDVDGADVAALREALIRGFHREVERVLVQNVQRFGHADGARDLIDGKNVVDVSCQQNGKETCQNWI